MRFTARREEADAPAPEAPPAQLPDVAETPIPTDFNLPEAFFAGVTLPGVPRSPAPPASAAAHPPVAPPVPAAPVDDFFGAETASPADDFFTGTASAPLSAVPPPASTLAGTVLPDVPPATGSPSRGAPPRTAPPSRRAGARAGARPLPSLAVLALGTLALVCLTLLAALVMSASTASPAVASAAAEGAPEPVAPAAPAATGPAGDADGSSLSADQLSALEAAANLPLTGELTAFLAAAEDSFGATSAQLDPALRPYAYRLASRFEWNPDTFRVAVAAPDAALAQSRVDVLTQVFADAVASGRLVLVPTTGPSALSIVAA